MFLVMITSKDDPSSVNEYHLVSTEPEAWELYNKFVKMMDDAAEDDYTPDEEEAPLNANQLYGGMVAIASTCYMANDQGDMVDIMLLKTVS